MSGHWELTAGMANVEDGYVPPRRKVVLEVTATHIVIAGVVIEGSGVGRPKEVCTGVTAIPITDSWPRITGNCDALTADAIFVWFVSRGWQIPEQFTQFVIGKDFGAQYWPNRKG